MKGPQEQYTDEMKKKFGFHATWLPGTPLLLGDIGLLKDNVFTRIAGLEDFEINFDIREDDSADDLEYSSKGSVSVTTKLSGSATPEGSTLTKLDAGFVVEFSNENAILFKANQARTNFIKNTIDVGSRILELYREGKWNKNWVVITEMVKAESATILISNSKNAKIELKASGDISASALDIADAELNLTATYSQGMETKIVSQSNLNPLFKTQGIKTRILMPPTFKNRGLIAFDLVTPNSAKNQHIDDLYFSYISSSETE